MSNLEFLCHSHFYIISKVTGAALAVDRYGSEDGGMKPNITINQYNVFDGEKQYNEAFKFSFKGLGAIVYEITSKRTGLSIAVKGDKVDHDKQPIVQTHSPQSISTVAQKSGISFEAAESCLTKPNLTSTLWAVTEVEDGVFTIKNVITDCFLSVPDHSKHNDSNVVQLSELSDLGHWEIRDAGLGQYNAPSDVKSFELQKDIRDNKYFKAAVPSPGDIPEVGSTATSKIDGLGKIIGIFPDQNATEELYKALVKAMKQIIDEALLKDNITDAISKLGTARQTLIESHKHKTVEELYHRMDQAVTIYNGPLGDLMNPANAKAGFPVFMQAATEQLTILREMAALAYAENDALETWVLKCSEYHGHLRKTYDAALKDRLALLTKEGFFSPVSMSIVHYKSHDNYQPSVNNGKLIKVDPDHFDTMYAWRVQQMTHEFNMEFGDVERLLALWEKGLETLE